MFTSVLAAIYTYSPGDRVAVFVPQGNGPCLLGDCWSQLAYLKFEAKSLKLLVPLPRLERGTPRSTIR
jgi:hypothetical protein